MRVSSKRSARASSGKERISSSGETGRLFESMRLLSQEQRDRIPGIENMSIQRLKNVIPYKRYGDALGDVITWQANPHMVDESTSSDPPSQWLSEIHYLIAAEELGLSDWSHLKVFPALGTALDIYHGTDLVFVYRDPVDPHKEPVVVTVDMTTNPFKDSDSCKADIVINQFGANAKSLLGGQAVHIDELEHSTREEDKAREAQIKKETARIVAEVIKAKIADYRLNDMQKGTKEIVRRIFQPLGKKISA